MKGSFLTCYRRPRGASLSPQALLRGAARRLVTQGRHLQAAADAHSAREGPAEQPVEAEVVPGGPKHRDVEITGALCYRCVPVAACLSLRWAGAVECDEPRTCETVEDSSRGMDGRRVGESLQPEETR